MVEKKEENEGGKKEHGKEKRERRIEGVGNVVEIYLSGLLIMYVKYVWRKS